MKSRCYPKYSYVIYFVISGVLFLFACAPVFIQTDDTTAIKLLWSGAMFVMSAIMSLGAMYYMQSYCFDNGFIVVKSIFGILVKMRIEDVCAYIETLPTYFSWVSVSNTKWICIYDKNELRNIYTRFESGCSNSRTKKRIQIIYTKQNEERLRPYIKISNIRID